MTDADTLFDAVCTVREQLEAEKGVSAIDGACHRNVVDLADYLYEETEFTPYVRWGAVDYYNKNYDSRMDAENDGAIHFWVEVELESGNWMIADAFSMQSDMDQIQRGEAVVAPELESYVVFPETLYEYTPRMEPGHLLGPEISLLKQLVDPAEVNGAFA